MEFKFRQLIVNYINNQRPVGFSISDADVTVESRMMAWAVKIKGVVCGSESEIEVTFEELLGWIWWKSQ